MKAKNIKDIYSSALVTRSDKAKMKQKAAGKMVKKANGIKSKKFGY